MNLKKNITIVTGHFGSGKTNFSMNLALRTAQRGTPVTLIDMDIVNPYFRSADFAGKYPDVHVLAPDYANSNVDLPYLGGGVETALEGADPVIVDVGGDDAGAVALGRYRHTLQAHDYDLLCVISCYRYLTRSPQECVAYLRDIEAACGLTVTGLVNNSNLGKETRPEDVRASVLFAEEVSRLSGVPLLVTAADKRLEGTLDDIEHIEYVDVLVKTIWDKEEEEWQKSR